MRQEPHRSRQSMDVAFLQDTRNEYKRKIPPPESFLFAYFNQDLMVEFENEEMAVMTYLDEDGT